MYVKAFLFTAIDIIKIIQRCTITSQGPWPKRVHCDLCVLKKAPRIYFVPTLDWNNIPISTYYVEVFKKNNGTFFPKSLGEESPLFFKTTLFSLRPFLVQIENPEQFMDIFS